MFFINLFLASTLAASAIAFKLPAGLGSGNYVAYLNETGHEVYEVSSPKLLAQLGIHTSSSTPVPPPQRAKSRSKALRAADSNFWMVVCGCGFAVDPGNTDRAVQSIKDQCGRTCNLYHDQAIFSIVDNVVAFICHGGVTAPELIGQAAAHITANCGRYIAGTAELEQEAWYQPDIGYMQYSPGLDFCLHAGGSSLTHC